MCLVARMCVPGKLHSAQLIVLLAVSSLIIKLKHILNKMSLNRNTHKTRLCIDQLKLL